MNKPIPIILAPMQGYADFVMRQILTEIGGFDEVVSEFVRITHTVHSRRAWLKKVPELNNQAQTQSGVPCVVQLLGSDAEKMAENALAAVNAGAKKIDVNFGCPAPIVNRHYGGAALLAEPEKIYRIIQTMRFRLPENISLTAKMRLGINDTQHTVACAEAIATGGATSLTIHARTKEEQYRPPAHWEWFAIIQEKINIPLIANGDIFSVADFQRLCTQCSPDGIMLGRGVLKNPYLALQIKAAIHQQSQKEIHTNDILIILQRFYQACLMQNKQDKYAAARLKQWLSLLQESDEDLQALFVQIKKQQLSDDIQQSFNTFQAA